MQDHVSFLQLDNNGSILGLFSDRDNIIVYYEDIQDSRYYVFTLDKFYTVEAVSEIMLPGEIDKSSFSFVSWFSPTQITNSGYQHKGICKIRDEEVRFTIDDFCILKVSKEPIKKKLLSKSFGCIANIQVEVFAQRGDELHVCGFDLDKNEQVYCKVDTVNDVCKKRYQLSSDMGDVKVNAIDVDARESRVYLGGEIARYDNDDRFQSAIPFFEIFLI